MSSNTLPADIGNPIDGREPGFNRCRELNPTASMIQIPAAVAKAVPNGWPHGSPTASRMVARESNAVPWDGYTADERIQRANGDESILLRTSPCTGSELGSAHGEDDFFAGVRATSSWA